MKGKRIVVTIKQIVPLMITEYKDDFSQFTFALRGTNFKLKKTCVYLWNLFYCVTDMQENFNANEKRLNKLSTDIDELNRRMAEYLQAINDKATNYYNCKT